MTRSVRLAAMPFLLALAACGGGAGAPEQAPACPAPPPDALVGAPLATVSGHQVGSVAWESYAARDTPADGAAWSLDEKRAVLEQAIDEEVLFREAFARGLYQDPKVRKILVNLLLRHEVYEQVSNASFTDAELEAHFEQHRSEFIVPEKIQLKRIFIAVRENRPEAEALRIATDIHQKLKASPEGFRELAITSSEDPFARRGGDVGFVDREGKPGVPLPVVQHAFTLEEGDISEPFLAAGGYNIVYVPTKRERIERTFEQMRGAVMRRMKNQRYEQLTQQFIDDLRKKSDISIDDAALTSFTPPVADRPGLRFPDGRAGLGSSTIGDDDPDGGSAIDQQLREMQEDAGDR